MGSQHVLGITWAQGAIKVRTWKAIDLLCWNKRTRKSKENRLRSSRNRVAQDRTPAAAQENQAIAQDHIAAWARKATASDNPHDVSVRALIAFPRKRTCCVVIVISKGLGSLPSPGDCAIDAPLKGHAFPKGSNWPRGKFLFVKAVL